jgi:hypothetical protein
MGTPEGTRLSRAFCSARDRNIPVLVRDLQPEPSTARGAGSSSTGPGRDSATSDGIVLVNCLDYGVRCTGWLCPLFAVPTLPAEGLIDEAIAAERNRRRRSIAEGRSILERARREARERGRGAFRKGVPSDGRAEH